MWKVGRVTWSVLSNVPNVERPIRSERAEAEANTGSKAGRPSTSGIGTDAYGQRGIRPAGDLCSSPSHALSAYLDVSCADVSDGSGCHDGQR